MIVTSKRNSMRSLLLWLKLKVIPIFSSDMLKTVVSVRVILGLSKKKHTQLLINERFEICSLLLDQFNSVFTSPITNMIVGPVSFFSCQSLNPDKCLNDIEITEQIIIDSIQELSSTSVAGPDSVPSSLLLKCAAVGCFDDLMHMLSSDTTVDMI